MKTKYLKYILHKLFRFYSILSAKNALMMEQFFYQLFIDFKDQ